MSESTDNNASSDVIAAVAIITFVLMGAIHFVYTGGLPAFLKLIF